MDSEARPGAFASGGEEVRNDDHYRLNRPWWYWHDRVCLYCMAYSVIFGEATRQSDWCTRVEPVGSNIVQQAGTSARTRVAPQEFADLEGPFRHFHNVVVLGEREMVSTRLAFTEFGQLEQVGDLCQERRVHVIELRHPLLGNTGKFP